MRPYLTPNEAAALLMVAPATLRVWSDKGLLHPLTTPGGHRRFLRDDLERFQRAHAGHGPGAARRRILIVDDEPAVTRYLDALLSAYPEVATSIAHDGFTAGSQLHVFRPDVVLLDLMMPGLDGFQVCRQIKSDAATRDIRVIAMTGYATPDRCADILAAGAEACLDKPLDEGLLFAALRLSGREA